ncbi:hypothetical protein LTR20_006425 [Exophiala xenobiotica]|nr:hypothetical protein LTR90_006989 [Exophiala xenobiotica]KAK5461501.1 hypothetical protein LTR20_006425 [Exophiala xenobiotica]KAK5482185.1 hypothetical protein LTR26_006519 [Exophiala xenobiotica]KAK5506892.1 hypothetical protein LTR21_009103 [Exophiala xenobiotica]
MHQRNPQSGADTPLLRTNASSTDQARVAYGTGSQRQETRHHFPLRRFPIPPTLPSDNKTASWTWAKPYNNKSQSLPQTIAHRGYKAKHPENTMKAFKGAVEVGTHAIETDIHLSRDGVVVLSHKEKIVDCDWDYLSGLRTIQEPHEPMPRLVDLLQYIAQPGLEHIWLLLDIKMDNNSDDVMRLIGETLASVNPGQRPWEERVLMGIWFPKFLPLCKKYVPSFPVVYIGFSTTMAREYLKVPNVAFNMLIWNLLGPVGARFMRDVRKAKRPLYVWTVNEPNLMVWCVQHAVDGVITDDPKTFKEICDDWDGKKKTARPTVKQWLRVVWVWIMIAIFSIPFRRRFPETVEQFIKEHDLRAKASLTIDQL